MRRLLTTVVVLVLITSIAVGGIGYYRGWFNVMTSSTAGESEVKITVDQNKVKQDVNQVKENAKQLLNSKAISGELKSIEPTTVTIAPKDGKPTVLRINEKTTITRNGDVIPMTELNVGVLVVARYTVAEHEKVAESITVQTK